MTNFEFEGNLQGVTEGQLKYIESVLQERGHKNGKVLFEAVGEAGDNYAANIKRIVVEKDGSTFKMIAKLASPIEALRNLMHTELQFRNEHYMYTEVLPKFSEILKEANVPESERLRYAACYGTNMEASNEVILLEDLLLSDYEMLDKFKSLSDETVKLVLKNIAILHSLSYVLKHQEPKTYEDFITKIVNIWDIMMGNDYMQTFFEQLEKDIDTVLDDEYKKRIKGSLSQLPNVSSKHTKIDDASKYSVIGQGDPWTNNFMFRIENGKTVDCCIIDYQIPKHCTPVSDIHHMIFNCTDHEIRSRHYHDWIDHYHSELKRILDNFGLKVENIYPREQLDADLKRYAEKTFGNSLFAASLIIRDTAEAEDMKDVMNKGVEEAIKSNNLGFLTEGSTLRLKNRIQGLIDSFVELGYMK